MKTFMTTLALLMATPLALRAEVTKNDLQKLCAAGLSDATILNFVTANAPLRALTAADLVDLRRSGASEALLSSLIGLGQRTSVPDEFPAPATAYSDVYSSPSTDQVPVYDDSSYPDDFCISEPLTSCYPSYCFPSFGLGLDLCAGLYSGCSFGTRCCRGSGGWYNPYHGYVGHTFRPRPVPVQRGPLANPGRGVGSTRGLGAGGSWTGSPVGSPVGGHRVAPAAGPIRRNPPSAGFLGSGHSFSGGSHPSGSPAGGGHSFGGGGHSSGGHGGGGHGGHR